MYLTLDDVMEAMKAKDAVSVAEKVREAEEKADRELKLVQRRVARVAAGRKWGVKSVEPASTSFPTLQRTATTYTAKYRAAMSSTLSNQALRKVPSDEMEVADSLLSLSRR